MDAGLLNGIGQALSGGVSSFRQAQLDKQKRHEDLLNNQIKLLSNNLEADPTTGLLKRDALGQTEYDNKANEADLAAQGYKSDSPYSAHTRQLVQGGMNAIKPGSGDSITEDLSQAEIKGLLPFLKTNETAIGAGVRNAATNDRIAKSQAQTDEKIGISRGRLEETQSQNAAHAGAAFTSDPIMKQSQTSLNSLDRAVGAMNGKTPVTSQTFAIIQNDLANAFAPGGVATEGKINRELVHTLQGTLNEIETKFGNVKDLRKEQPQVFAQVQGLITQVSADFKRAMAQRAKELAGNYTQTSNKKIQATVADKLKSYSGPEEKPQGLLPQPAQDPTILKYSQMHNLPYDQSAAILKSRGYNGQ